MLCCALFCQIVETSDTLFKYVELFLKTYAALPYIIAALSNMNKEMMHLEEAGQFTFVYIISNTECPMESNH
jgi:hypothetical protein